MIDRRTFLAAGALLAGACARPLDALKRPADDDALAAIRATLGAGARLGVAALDTGSGRALRHDADSRYAMCSTFKAPLAAAVLGRVDRGEMALTDRLPVTGADLLSHSPRASERIDAGHMTLEAMCAAIVEVSDNAAANILLRQIGGPAGFTAFVRRCGDRVTRLDRYELELNSNIPGDPRDTTTPAAMLELMRTLLLGDVLKPESRTRLAHWMERATTGMERLRAGFPPSWRVGDKTGTGNGAANVVAIAWPPGRSPILVTSYIDAREASNGAKNAVHAAVARLVAERLG